MAAPAQPMVFNECLVDAGFQIITVNPTEDAQSLFVRPCIPSSYHWVPIAGLPANAVLANSDLFMRSAMARLVAHPVPNQGNEARRKTAIILGFMRAVMTAYYGLTDNSLIPGERAAAMIVHVPATVGANAHDAYTHYATGVEGATLTALNTPLNLSEGEKDALATLLLSAIGAPVVQGISLMTVNHPYLSGNAERSRRAFDVMERQLWDTSVARSWFVDDRDLVRDVVWHKAAHPILVAEKTSWAMDPDIKVMLVKAGVGSAAARLPAEEPNVRNATTRLKLCRTVEPMLTSYGGKLVYAPLERAIEWVRHFAPSRVVKPRPAGMPLGIVSRRSAVEYLEAVVAANEANIALLYGFYSAQIERDVMTGANERADTLIRANSLAKLATDCPPAFNQGKSNYDDYLAARAKSRENGDYRVLKMRFVEVGAEAADSVMRTRYAHQLFQEDRAWSDD